jgi:hypothetical protein
MLYPCILRHLNNPNPSKDRLVSRFDVLRYDSGCYCVGCNLLRLICTYKYKPWLPTAEPPHCLSLHTATPSFSASLVSRPAPLLPPAPAVTCVPPMAAKPAGQSSQQKGPAWPFGQPGHVGFGSYLAHG